MKPLIALALLTFVVPARADTAADIAALANRSPRIGFLPPVTPTAKARTAAAVVRCG